MKNHKYFIFGILILLILINVGFVSAQEFVTSDAGVEYDSGIAERLNERSFSQIVIVYLKNSNKSFLFSDYSEEEIKNIYIHPSSSKNVALEVTKQGFNKLIGDRRIERIVFERMLISDVCVEYEFNILEQFNRSEWVEVIIEINNESERDSIFSQFSEEEFKDIIYREISPTIIGVTTTKSGFGMLIEDEKVEKVYYNLPGELFGDSKKGIERESNLNNNLLWILLIIGIIVVMIVIFIIYKIKK